MKAPLDEAEKALNQALTNAEAEIRGWGVDVSASVDLPGFRWGGGPGPGPGRRHGPNYQLRWSKDPNPTPGWALFVNRTPVLYVPLGQRIAAAEVLARGDMSIALERAVEDLTKRTREAEKVLRKWLATLSPRV